MPNSEADPTVRILIDFLHIFVLVSFAFAQPIYDILGQNPEFFVARRASPSSIINLILLLSAGLALLFVFIELCIRILSSRFRRFVHGGFVLILAILIVAPSANRWIVDNNIVMGIFTMVVAFVFTGAYICKNFMRFFVTALVPAILFFPLWFLLATPVMRLVMPKTIEAQGATRIENKVPVILVVLDEFSTTALLNSREQIDATRFPNFASLAAESYWYPNAVTISQATELAIPSILTGRNPRRGEKLLPTKTDYPKNLFTMLEGDYEITASEGMTAFMQRDSVVLTQESEIRQYIAMLSDVTVIYLHLVVPREFADKLPTLDARWSGFGKKIVNRSRQITDRTIRQALDHPDLSKRAEQQDHFITNLRSGSRPELFFIHILLPHVPYHYLASGHVYASGDAMPEGYDGQVGSWSDDNPLIVTAYYRYLQQVGYVDIFLGKLKSQLISEGIYDEALVIVTADHGVAFQPGESRREYETLNVNEILKIPMFVKLPGQKEGHRDDRVVSGVDVLPTIVDVLGVSVSWKFDGSSMLHEHRMVGAAIEIEGEGQFDEKDILGFSRLAWQVENFGENTSLNQLVSKDQNYNLVRRNVDEFKVGSSAGMILKSSNLDYFDQVDKQSFFLPALFQGHIEGTNRKNLPITFSVNDKIWATTHTSQWNERENYFSVMFPPDAFVQGKNVVNAYLLERDGKELILRLIRKEKRLAITLRQKESDKLYLLLPGGLEIPVEDSRSNMDGYLDSVTFGGGMLSFQGWAADLIDSQPATSILIFQGEKLVHQVAPDVSRNGVVKLYSRPSLLRSGYRAYVPLNALDSRSYDISVIALSKNKRAFRLRLKDSHEQLIRRALANQM